MFALFLNILSDDFRVGLIAHRSDIAAIAPEFVSPELFAKLGKRLEHFFGGNTFHDLHDVRWGIPRGGSDEQMDMIPIRADFIRLEPIGFTDFLDCLGKLGDSAAIP